MGHEIEGQTFGNYSDGLALKGLKEASWFTLFNLNGKVVIQQYVEANQQGIDIGDLPAGNYFYSMEGRSHFFRGKLNIQ